MGNGKSKGNPTEKTKSDQLDSQLHRAKEKESEVIKLLLLGAGESGKSTLFKQMLKLYGGGFQKTELTNRVPMIISNIMSSMKELIYQSAVLPDSKCRIQTKEALASQAFFDANVTRDERSYVGKLTLEEAKHIKTLWADPGIKECYAQRSKFQLLDSCNYFFDNIDRIATPNYVPTDMDVIHSRVRTTGIVEHNMVIDDTKFLLVDVGGQRNERKKWIHAFDKVTAVLWVAALCDYDTVLYEDGKTNRMSEALQLFKETCHLPTFSSIPFILFLNKTDIFFERIQRVPFTVWPSDYRGNPHDAQAVIDFIRKQYENLYRNDRLYVHVTNATDSDNIRAVFTAVKDIIIQRHLAESGLLTP